MQSDLARTTRATHAASDWRRAIPLCIIAAPMFDPRTPLVAMLSLAACSKPLLQDAAGRMRVVSQVPIGDIASGASALQAALREHRGIAAVVALDTAASVVVANTDPAGSPRPRRLTFGDPPPANATLDSDVRLVDETGAAAAVDMALLWLHDIAPPAKLPLGTRAFTAANHAAGGTPRPAPGDLIVSMLRTQHPDVVTTQPATDVIHPLGFVSAADGSWHQHVGEQVRAAAKRYPQLELHTRAAKGDAAAVPNLLAELLERGCRAILVSGDANLVTPFMARAEERRLGIFVLDPALHQGRATCVLGADPEVLGRAAGEQLAVLLPNGGDFVLVQHDTDEQAKARLRGFSAALGLRQP